MHTFIFHMTLVYAEYWNRIASRTISDFTNQTCLFKSEKISLSVMTMRSSLVSDSFIQWNSNGQLEEQEEMLWDGMEKKEAWGAQQDIPMGNWKTQEWHWDACCREQGPLRLEAVEPIICLQWRLLHLAALLRPPSHTWAYSIPLGVWNSDDSRIFDTYCPLWVY